MCSVAKKKNRSGFLFFDVLIWRNPRIVNHSGFPDIRQSGASRGRWMTDGVGGWMIFTRDVTLSQKILWVRISDFGISIQRNPWRITGYPPIRSIERKIDGAFLHVAECYHRVVNLPLLEERPHRHVASTGRAHFRLSRLPSRVARQHRELGLRLHHCVTHYGNAYPLWWLWPCELQFSGWRTLLPGGGKITDGKLLFG